MKAFNCGLKPQDHVFLTMNRMLPAVSDKIIEHRGQHIFQFWIIADF